jgi:hypothetical protein
MLWLPGKVNRRIETPLLLYNQTLSGNDRFDVTGIPPGYSLMRINALLRSSISAVAENMYLILNGDTTAANYRQTGLYAGTAASPPVTSAPADNLIVGICTGATAPANTFTQLQVDILYSHSQHKTWYSETSDRQSATDMVARFFATVWENTAAINQITLQPAGYATNNFVASSQLQIWLYR